MPKPLFKRVLLKLSGEALMGEQKFGFEQSACEQIAQAIKEVHSQGVQMGLVIGGGNVFRGVLAKQFGFERTPADHIGMLGTTINGLILQQSLASAGVKSHVMSALATDSIVDKYHWGHAIELLEKNIPVIFVGGTGNPYFTTDTAGALRASEIHAEILLKATKVDGIYSEDPKKNPRAAKFETLSYQDALEKNFKVMDATSIALCRDSQIPIYVFNLFEKGALLKAVTEKKGGTLIQGE
jgi:uridylate kinase